MQWFRWIVHLLSTYFIFKDLKSTNYYLQEDNNIAEVWFFTQVLQLVGRIKVYSIVPTLTLVLELVEAVSDCWSNPHNLIGDQILNFTLLCRQHTVQMICQGIRVDFSVLVLRFLIGLSLYPQDVFIQPYMIHIVNTELTLVKPPHAQYETNVFGIQSRTYLCCAGKSSKEL